MTNDTVQIFTKSWQVNDRLLKYDIVYMEHLLCPAAALRGKQLLSGRWS